MLSVALQIELKGKGRIAIELIVAAAVAVDEVIAQLNLRTEGNFRRDIIPQLWLGEDNEVAMTVGGIDATPEVDEASKGELVAGKSSAPDTCHLE